MCRASTRAGLHPHHHRIIPALHAQADACLGLPTAQHRPAGPRSRLGGKFSAPALRPQAMHQTQRLRSGNCTCSKYRMEKRARRSVQRSQMHMHHASARSEPSPGQLAAFCRLAGWGQAILVTRLLLDAKDTSRACQWARRWGSQERAWRCSGQRYTAVEGKRMPTVVEGD